MIRQLALKLRRFTAAAMAVAATSSFAYGQVLFIENFDSLLPTLEDSVNERVGTAIVTRVASDPNSTPIAGVWSSSATGWTKNNNLNTYDGAATVTPGVPGQGVADYGVDEWEGWNFARKDFWAQVDPQDRQLFGTTSGASGTVAVADSDEYFDLGDPDNATHGGYYNTSLVSPSIPVVGGGFYGLGFDSSWRDEAFDDSTPAHTNLNNQAVEIVASFDVGGNRQVVKWNSNDADPLFFKNDTPDEHFDADGVDIPAIEVPAGATSMQLQFNYANAGNDWWWAIDNIVVQDLTGSAGTVFSENFESSVTLGNSVNERLGAGSRVTSAPGSTTTILGTQYPTTSKTNAFTHTPPTGTTVDTVIDAANQGDNNVGVFEWEGWSFATPEFWTFADTQERQNFTKGTGVVAIADGDEWTDLGSPTGKMLTVLRTPAVGLGQVDPSELVRITFDSSWRSENGQIGILTALLDGIPTELFRWEGGDDIVPGGDRDRTVEIELDPGNASVLQLLFSYEGGNNWWWAIDNIRIESVAIPEPSAGLLALVAIYFGTGRVNRRRRN
jgi:hypothetical protein